MTMKRREFLATASTASGAMLVGGGSLAEAGQPRTPAAPKQGYPTRVAKVEMVFTAPGLSSNGLQCTAEGIWSIDNAGSRSDTPGRCKVYLTSYEGKILRELAPEGTGPSGIGVDEDGTGIWIGSTYSREIIHADAKTGETISKHFTPGAGVIYRMTTDLPQRPDTYGRTVRAASQAAAPSAAPSSAVPAAQVRRPADGQGVGRGGAIAGNPGPPAPGTGAHGVQTQAGKLWVAVPPGRMIYRIDPKTWMVEHMFPSVANRPHGIGIESATATHLWESDTNMGGFFKRDMVTGEIVESIQIPEGSPYPHGMSVWNGYIYWSDDIGGSKAPVCRTKI